MTFTFRFHPDPIASGSIVRSARRCRCCREKRGWIYSGPTYAAENLDRALCPGCIADGRAHAELGVTFVDSDAFEPPLPADVAAEICERTPGFATYQSERWLSCCGGPAAFDGPAGVSELRSRYPRLEAALIGVVVHELGISGTAARTCVESLQRDHSPTAFVFRCRECQRHLAYVDHV